MRIYLAGADERIMDGLLDLAGSRDRLATAIPKKRPGVRELMEREVRIYLAGVETEDKIASAEAAGAGYLLSQAGAQPERLDKIMRIHLAGVENPQWVSCNAAAGTEHVLASALNPPEVLGAEPLYDRLGWRPNRILDSGLFSLMWGGQRERGQAMTTYEDFATYTRDYQAFAEPLGFDYLVETDTQKLIGSELTQRLRDEFWQRRADLTIFVWHMEDGLDGLDRMVDRYPYIALSIPELRHSIGRKRGQLHPVVFGLLRRIRQAAKSQGHPEPKVHLLGNTEPALMSTAIAYSCDSTSWLAAGRWRQGVIFTGRTIETVPHRSQRFEAWIARFMEARGDHVRAEPKFVSRVKRPTFWTHYYISQAASAYAFVCLQSYLDGRYTHAEARELGVS